MITSLAHVRTAIRGLLIRLTHYAVKNPEWATDTATCGRPLVLGEDHYTFRRDAERLAADGEVHTLDEHELGFVHIECWSSDRVTLQVIFGGPDHARLTAGAADITL